MSGPESTVLEEQIDPNYVPSQQEVDEYAKWLGMDTVEDAHLMWIAQEGLKAPLPSDWKPCKSPDGEIYYFNFNDGSSVWDHPCDEKYRSLYQAEKKKNPKPQPAPAPSRDAKPKKRPKASASAGAALGGASLGALKDPKAMSRGGGNLGGAGDLLGPLNPLGGAKRGGGGLGGGLAGLSGMPGMGPIDAAPVQKAAPEKRSSAARSDIPDRRGASTPMFDSRDDPDTASAGSDSSVNSESYQRQKDAEFEAWKKEQDKAQKLAKVELMNKISKDAHDEDDEEIKRLEKENAQQIRSIRMETDKLNSQMKELETQSPMQKPSASSSSNTHEDELAKSEAKLETQQLKMSLDHELQKSRSTEERKAETVERDAMDTIKSDMKKQTKEAVAKLQSEHGAKVAEVKGKTAAMKEKAESSGVDGQLAQQAESTAMLEEVSRKAQTLSAELERVRKEEQAKLEEALAEAAKEQDAENDRLYGAEQENAKAEQERRLVGAGSQHEEEKLLVFRKLRMEDEAKKPSVDSLLDKEKEKVRQCRCLVFPLPSWLRQCRCFVFLLQALAALNSDWSATAEKKRAELSAELAAEQKKAEEQAVAEGEAAKLRHEAEMETAKSEHKSMLDALQAKLKSGDGMEEPVELSAVRPQNCPEHMQSFVSPPPPGG